MGYWKNKQLEDEANRGWALHVLHEADVLDQCEIHNEYFNAYIDDVEAAYRLANRKITAGTAPFDHTERRQATDAIKAAFEEHQHFDECASCRNFMEKD